jgi:hypothetical protein
MRWSLLALILLLVPGVAAQINGPLEFSAEYGFTNANAPGFITIISGAMEAEIDARQETWGFMDATGLQINGVEKVCHQRYFTSPAEEPCIEGQFKLVVVDGSAVGLKLPTGVGHFDAGHTLGFLATSQGSDLNSLILNESLVAPSINGRMTYTTVRAADPTFLPASARLAAMAAAVPLFDGNKILLLAAGNQVASFERDDGALTFAGSDISIPSFDADTAILPFTEQSRLSFSPAPAAAAKQGISMSRIQDVQRLMVQASEDPSQSATETEDSPIIESLSEVLDAALVRFPIGDNATAQRIQDETALVLFSSMVVTNSGDGLRWNGQAAFQYENGEVKGAQSLSGFWYIQLPIWGWLLWIGALGAFIARLVVKPARTHERWDNYRWAGWLAGVAMFVLVFVMWDFEMRAVWGTSVLSTETAGTAFWMTFALQMATLSLVIGAVGWPISIIIKNALLLSKQGTFMGLGKPVSLLVSYLLGATLFLAYLQLLISSVMSNIGG